MKIICANQNIKEILSIAERNVSKNQTLPILNSVFLNAEDGKLQVRATNLETAIEANVFCTVKEKGSLVIPAKILYTYLSNINDEQITLQSQKSNLFIKTNNSETVIRGMSVDEFPLFPKIDVINSFSMPCDLLKESLSQVVSASSQSEIKPELASVLFKIFKNSVKFAATDSFRLAEKTIVSKTINSDKQYNFLVPQKSVHEILRILVNNEIINVGFGKNQMILETKQLKFISRLTDGVFPDYEQIIPKTFKTDVLITHNSILKNLKIASIFVGKLNEINLNFEPHKKLVLISASHPEAGEHSSEVSANIEGEEVNIKFNYKYLLDGISQINSEYISFNLNGSDSPLLIKGKGDSSFIYLAMPMRV
ncbi:DNA polymerase III subunit beta [Candidatus Giovannonibacteria bacterium]|nr:DNA polymerase III subunit beta [Candidatus Giovannonibacteria bacterium]